jgi:hypothetical protein
MIIDCHCHIYTKEVILGMTSRKSLVEEVKLGIDIEHRSDAQVLDDSAKDHQVECCILLPVASPDKVQAENNYFLSIAAAFPRFKALATLHPQMKHLAAEVERMSESDIAGFKLSSFSQRFDLASGDAEKMFLSIAQIGRRKKKIFTLVLDTFNRADFHFGADPNHISTPAKLSYIAERHPDIRFLGAHMGGLAADFNRLHDDLKPAPNIYLDTSNAAHTLTAEQFVALLQKHGPDHILFGTDWPWFGHETEIPLIDALLDRAGFDRHQKEFVFCNNAKRIFQI